MKRENLSNAIGNIGSRYIQEAADYAPAKGKVRMFRTAFGKSIIAAALALCILAGGIVLLSLPRDMAITVYAFGTNEEFTASGAVIQTGAITDSGSMSGHPLMFYLMGKDIASVRFSCKNQQLYFMDWTEKREEYGLAQNFTVPYGEDESEYYYLTVDWTPNATIEKLHEGYTIRTLPNELREDMIVMEITFANGKTAVKAIIVSLLDDGTFFATFDDYRITSKDDFLNRPDSEAIPRDILYAPDDSINQTESIPVNDAPVTDSESQENHDSEDEIIENSTDIQDSYVAGTDDAPNEVTDEAEATARAYYTGTVFQVVEIVCIEQSETEIIFSVKVSRGGVVQEPNRTITLQLNGDVWEVTNEGY